MGKRGPAPKPTALKLLQGTHRKDRAPANEPDPEIAIPSRPSWLGKMVPWGREAVREWQRIAPLLAETHLLSELDRTNLAAYCDAHGRFWHFRREVAKRGTIQVAESGYVAQRPEVTMMNRALEDLRRFGALFGLSPSDRTRVNAAEPKKKDGNPFKNLGS